jgi:hypothetical protein
MWLYFHIPIWNRTMKPPAIALSGGEGFRKGRWWGWSNQYTRQAYSELSRWIPPYHKYILVKMKENNWNLENIISNTWFFGRNFYQLIFLPLKMCNPNYNWFMRWTGDFTKAKSLVTLYRNESFGELKYIVLWSVWDAITKCP